MKKKKTGHGKATSTSPQHSTIYSRCCVWFSSRHIHHALEDSHESKKNTEHKIFLFLFWFIFYCSRILCAIQPPAACKRSHCVCFVHTSGSFGAFVALARGSIRRNYLRKLFIYYTYNLPQTLYDLNSLTPC